MAQITVNAKTYELVPLNDLTLDEAMVMWEYTKISLDQIPDLEGFNPGVTAALIHIAVARAETGETTKTIRQVVGQIKMSELEQVFAQISEDVEELPPPNAPEPSSPSSGSGETSSPTGEPAQAPTPANGSGSRGLDTGATYDRVTSAL
jgi:hypothetical protein